MVLDRFTRRKKPEFSTEEVKQRLERINTRISELNLKWSNINSLRRIVEKGENTEGRSIDEAVSELWEWIDLINDKRKFEELISGR